MSNKLDYQAEVEKTRQELDELVRRLDRLEQTACQEAHEKLTELLANEAGISIEKASALVKQGWRKTSS